MLNREDILGMNDIKIEIVSVPEWGGDVYVRNLSGHERDEFEASIVERRGKKQTLNASDLRAKLAAYSICDENGKRLFSESDVRVLTTKSASSLQRVFEVAQRLSGIGDDAVSELVDDLKNDQRDGSISD